MDIKEIMNLLPHQYPFLLLDKIVRLVKGESALGIKNVTINEPYFQGHFRENPVVPGVLIIESCAQLLGIVCADEGEPQRKHQYLASVKEFNFKRPVCPGDTMYIDVKVTHSGFNLIQGDIRVKTQQGLVAVGTLVNTHSRQGQG